MSTRSEQITGEILTEISRAEDVWEKLQDDLELTDDSTGEYLLIAHAVRETQEIYNQLWAKYPTGEEVDNTTTIPEVPNERKIPSNSSRRLSSRLR